MLKSFLKYPAILICCFIVSICNVSKSDQTVSEIQTVLKDQGYNVGIVDGISGKKTVREIKNWQYLNAFDESGNINQEQLNILRMQYSFGKTLTNEEIKILEERNKRAPTITKKSNIQKKEKDEVGFFENILEKVMMISLAISVFIGLFVSNTRDKRTRSGYRGTNWVTIGIISGLVFGATVLIHNAVYGANFMILKPTLFYKI